MKQTDRIVVYIIGFVIGTLLVSAYLNNRQTEASKLEAERITQSQWPDEVKPLPESVPTAFLKGELMDFGLIENRDQESVYIWILEFSKSYPYVRISHNLKSDEIEIMAADQVIIHTREDIDITVLKPELDKLGLKVRMFNRSKNMMVIGVLNRDLNTIPETLEAIKPWSHLYRSASADYISVR
tara:strand:+ start:681 stop:1232 length:552 start_codon:yes stop_codon:yes gene_type:complete